MKKQLPVFLIGTLLLLILSNCAKKGMPKGGPEDKTPPKFIRASPENYSTNFDAKKISILFNEYIKLKNPTQQIIISPPMDPKPSIVPLGTARKDVEIEIFDTLAENTTYTINFGKSIIDNNESNPLDYFKYVFSTGDYLDSLSVSGTVSDANLKEPDNFISIYLYEVDSTFSDSAVYKQTPRYLTYTRDSTIFFNLENLKAGKYQMLAIEDKNNNYLYNPGSEKIGFLDHYIEVPTDSTYHLSLFKEELNFDVDRPKQLKGQQILFGYKGPERNLDSLKINLLNPKPANFTSRIVKDPKTDTLYYWYSPKVETDSLSFEVVNSQSRDTLYTKISPESPRDSIKISAEPSGGIEFNQNLKLKSNTPLVAKNEDFMSLLDKDSTAVPFTSKLELIKNEVVISFEKTESNTYYFQALPGAVTDIFAATNDTLQKKLTTKAYSEYGSYKLSLRNVRSHPIIAQFTNLKGEVQQEVYKEEGNTFNFEHLKPDDYFIRIIYDTNKNKRWDTGNYLNKIHAEEIQYYPDTIEVRSNWDQNQDFILE